jgi:Flp pilus assembly protein TadB
MFELFLWYLDKFIDIVKTKDALVKLGINFITAGLVGVFVNHIVGYDISTMMSTAVLIACFGLACLVLGLRRDR